MGEAEANGPESKVRTGDLLGVILIPLTTRGSLGWVGLRGPVPRTFGV